MRFEFGDYQLDDERVTLTGPDGPIHCEPQVFRVLHHLVLNRHRAVPKEELLDVVWGDRFVSESALTSRLKAARRAVGDSGSLQHTIKTVHGIGYHFVAEVTAIATETVASVPVPARDFPALRTALIGRDADVGGVLDTVRRARATTITGPGGVGKTTLAVAAGRRLRNDFADGAIFVDLTAARSAGDVTRVLAEAGGVEGDASRSIERLAEHLATRRILVVIDNCEQVLAAAGEAVDLLLARGSEARMLATSREPLAVPGEHVWPLAPLDTAAPVLFVERARAADPRIPWAADDPEIIELCERLDGLPLALELAAGQLRRWGFAELARQLRGGMSALARNPVRSDARHVTMAAAVDWSYQLLENAERSLLRHLSVFPSSFAVRSAEAMASGLQGVEMPATLGGLVDKSLVVRDPASDRFHMLETIRVFARNHLDAEGEADTALERLRSHVVDEARSTSRLDRWLSARLGAQRRADAEQARQAFRASLDQGHVDDAVEIALGGAFLWRNAIGCTEGGGWVRELLERELSPVDRAWVSILRADVGQGIGDFRQMMSAEARAGAVDDGSDPAAACIAAHYGSLAHLTDPGVAPDRLADVVAMAPDDRLSTLMQAYMLVPEIAAGGGDDIASRLDRLHVSASEDGYDRFILNWVGWMDGLARRDADAARLWMGRQQEFLERTGIVETWLTSLSTALSESVDGSDVTELLSRALAIAEREGYRADADGVLALAYSDACQGRARRAAELLGTAIGSRFNATAHYVLYRVVVEPVVRRQIDDEAFADAIDRGSRRPAAEVLAERGIGRVVRLPSGGER